MWSKFLLSLAATLALTGNASAQDLPDVNVPGADARRSQMLEKYQELRRQKRLDDAYKAARNKIPDQKRNDPWGDVRSPPTNPAAKK